MPFPLLAAAAPIVGGLLGFMGSKSNSKAIEQANKANAPDPRIAETIFGKDGSLGLVDKYKALGDSPQNAGLLKYGQNSDSYLGNFAETDMQRMRDSAGVLQGGGDLASIGAWAKGNMVDAPAQNNLNLAPAYDRMINGDAGANPYLTRALQGGMDQSRNVFDQMQGNATENLMENIMPSIRSNSVLAGQYGGSRQGIAEGNAIGDFAKAQQQTINQFGQNNTNQALGAQAGAFNAGQDRSLAAMQGLGAQQYGVAQQNAQTKNAAEFMNVNNVNDISKFNAQQSNVNRLAGLGAQQGLLGQTVGAATNQDNYALNKAGQVNGLLSPYLSQNGGGQQMPITQNTAGSVLGGAMTGLGLYNQFNQASPPPRNNGMGTGMNYDFQPTKLPINTGALQNLNFLGK